MQGTSIWPQGPKLKFNNFFLNTVSTRGITIMSSSKVCTRDSQTWNSSLPILSFFLPLSYLIFQTTSTKALQARASASPATQPQPSNLSNFLHAASPMRTSQNQSPSSLEGILPPSSKLNGHVQPTAENPSIASTQEMSPEDNQEFKTILNDTILGQLGYSVKRYLK